MRTSKKNEILTAIITDFENLQSELDYGNVKRFAERINTIYRSSNNQKDLARKILNEVVLSNDEIVSLLKICFKKKKDFYND